MKKLLIICTLVFFCLQSFSFSPGFINTNTPYALPANLNGMSLQEFVKLTPKKYMELTGAKLTFKEKVAFTILKAKLKRKLAQEKPDSTKTDIGKLSLIFGGAAFVLALIPYAGIISIPLAIAAVVLGIIGLGRKKNDTKSIIGLVLGGVFIFLVAVVIATFSLY